MMDIALTAAWSLFLIAAVALIRVGKRTKQSLLLEALLGTESGLSVLEETSRRDRNQRLYRIVLTLGLCPLLLVIATAVMVGVVWAISKWGWASGIATFLAVAAATLITLWMRSRVGRASLSPTSSPDAEISEDAEKLKDHRLFEGRKGTGRPNRHEHECTKSCVSRIYGSSRSYGYLNQYSGKVQIPTKVYVGDAHPISLDLHRGLDANRKVRLRPGDAISEDDVLQVELIAPAQTIGGDAKQSQSLTLATLHYHWECYFPQSGTHTVSLRRRWLLPTGRKMSESYEGQ